MSTELRVVANAEELRRLVELVDVVCTELSAVRRDADEETDGDEVPSFGLTPAVSTDGTGLKVTVIASMDLKDAAISVEHDVYYRLTEPIEDPSDEVMGGFLGASTVMTVAPFVREAFRSLGSRIRIEAPILGMLQPENLFRGEATRVPRTESSPLS